MAIIRKKKGKRQTGLKLSAEGWREATRLTILPKRVTTLGFTILNPIRSRPRITIPISANLSVRIL